MSQTLIRDGLDRVIANPTASQRWHRLLGLYTATSDTLARQSICQSLMDNVAADGIGGFFRATFLAGVTTETAHIADAGRLVQEIRPVDPERLMAFAAFEWGRAVALQGDRGDFITRLEAARLPGIVSSVGVHLSQAAAGSVPARGVDRVRRVAVVAPFIGLLGHTPTELTLRHAKVLQALGLEVRVFSGQEFLMHDMPEYLGNSGRVVITPPDRDYLAKVVPPGVKLTLGDARFSLMRRWQGILTEVAAFDPDLVLFIGLQSPMLTPLYAARPVLGLCVHSMAPMAPVDVWLTATKSLAGQWSSPWAPAFPPAWGYYHPYRVMKKPVGEPVTRAQLGIAEERVVLVTVGARLGSEIAGDWAARMAALIAGSEDLVWVLVGGEGVVPAALGDVAGDRLRVLAHRDDIGGVLRCCDIYVNPPRIGGGFSVAEAMAEGLSVVAFADSDGGSKVGGFAVDTMDRYFDLVQALVSQPALRERIGTELRAVFSMTLDLDQSGPSLLTACEQAVVLFRQRMGFTD